ncbi:MAG: methionine--tRNA ligase [Patescibacteria group bacterium]
MSKNVLVAIAWPYVNGELHIGHLAGYLLPADICARFHRAIGNNVLMVSGSDCHGTPITVEADKKGLTPPDIVKEYHAKDVHLFKNVLKLSYDNYTKTDTKNHAEITQAFFLSLLENDYIEIKTQKQYFSPTENRFLPDRYVVGECPFCGFEEARSDQCDDCGKLINQGEVINPKSNISGDPVILKDTEHYFVNWEKAQKNLNLEKYIDETSKKYYWKNWVYQQTKGWLKEGLQSRAITRDLDWGVPLPIDQIPKDKQIENINNKRFYVWFDAVIGYYSASIEWAKEIVKEPNAWEKFWYDNKNNNEITHYYFMGKDNLVFHTLFWPAKLKVFDKSLHLPDVQAINQYLNFAGKQFSKSRGHSIKIEDIVNEYGNDAVRFYLTLIMPETKDSSFSWEDFVERVNGDLVNNLGNFIQRTLSLGIDTKLDSTKMDSNIKTKIEESFANARDYLEKAQFRDYLQVVLELSSKGNEYVNENTVWESKKTNAEKFSSEIATLYSIVVALATLLIPLLPDASKNIFNLLNIKDQNFWPEISQEIRDIQNIMDNIDTKVKPVPLFKRLDPIESK